MSLLGRLLLNASPASEMGSLLPLEPVVRVIQRGLALPAGWILLKRHSDKGNLLDSDGGANEFLVDDLNCVLVSLEHMGNNCSLLRNLSLIELSRLFHLKRNQLRVGKLGRNVSDSEDCAQVNCLLFGGCAFLFFSCWSSEFFLVLCQQDVDCFFEVNGARMAEIVDFSELVDQAHEGDATDGKVLDELVIAVPTEQGEMLDLVPLLGVDSSCDQGLVFIDTHCYNPYIFAPCGFVLLQHFLVVLHRPLAGPAPGRPNIHQQNLSRPMLQHRLPLIEHIIHLPIIPKHSSNWQRLGDISRNSQFINLLSDTLKLLGRHILADAALQKLLLPLYDVSHSGSLLNEVEVLLLNRGEFISLVVLQDLDHLFHGQDIMNVDIYSFCRICSLNVI